MPIPKIAFKKMWEFTEASDAKRIASQTPPAGVAVESDIPYLDDGTREHLLDFYYPEGTEGLLPLIIDIHGGGWMYGYKEINKYYCMYLASRGFTVMSINYRLCPEVHLGEQIRDVFDALNWAETNAPLHHGDVGNAFLCGDSAGAHYTAISLAIMDRPDLASVYGVTPPGYAFRAAGLVSGAYDIKLFQKVPAGYGYAEIILGRDFRTNRLSTLSSMSDIMLVKTKLPPVFMVSSSEDFLLFLSDRFDKLLTSEGIEHDYRRFGRSKQHALPHVFCVTQPFYEESREANDAMLGFFRRHLAR